MKPANWPRYMLSKRLTGGRTGYYWSPHKRDLLAGCTLQREKLGFDFGPAIAKAELLNKHLDAWRQGRDAPKDLDLQPDKWAIASYYAIAKRARLTCGSQRVRQQFGVQS